VPARAALSPAKCREGLQADRLFPAVRGSIERPGTRLPSTVLRAGAAGTVGETDVDGAEEAEEHRIAGCEAPVRVERRRGCARRVGELRYCCLYARLAGARVWQSGGTRRRE